MRKATLALTIVEMMLTSGNAPYIRNKVTTTVVNAIPAET
jgi:hypothetical protein